MAQQIIDVGPAPNDGLGDPLRTAFEKTNDNFAQLFANAGSTSNSIINGTSNVRINTANGNISMSVGGISNVLVVSNTQIAVTGNISATANLVAGNFNTAGSITATGNIQGNYILGNGSQLTGLPASYGNANVAAYLPTYSGNLASLNGPVTTSGAVTGGSLLTAGFVSATGNITGSYLFGNGAFLTGISGGGGGNSTAIVNGLSQVAIPTSAGNVAVTVGFSSNIVVINNNGLISTGQISANVFTSSTTVSAAGNVMAGNIMTSGLISATGNVTGAYIIGDGTFLTNVGVGSSYGNANVAAYLPTYTGNLAGGNLSVTGQSNVSGNINVHNTARVNGVVQGQLYGLTNGVNTIYGTWDFGFVAANTYNNPIQWIFAQTTAGNVDMGNITAPASLNIDIGSIF